MTSEEVLEHAVEQLALIVSRTEKNPRQAQINLIRKHHITVLATAKMVYAKGLSAAEADRRVAYELTLARTILNELKPGWNLVRS